MRDFMKNFTVTPEGKECVLKLAKTKRYRNNFQGKQLKKKTKKNQI